MSQNRLVNTCMSIVHPLRRKKIAEDIDLTSVAREFTEAKARRVKF